MTDIRPTQKEIEDSLERIAMTLDGQNLYIFLQRRVMTVTHAPTDGALRQDEGERSFAAKLIGLMAKGIADSGGRTSNSTGSSNGAEQPVVLPVAEPVAVTRARGAGRRITADTHVPGWDRPRGE
ncbi:hypothetical protein [Bradyrhizobium sp. Arg816]|uniref:hypothetical protein n=1 Tax=Bradyrhizobium sp. Arg816 TaxID=2998491 RepID=UPI00249F6DD6|nr:hypothetical protein [Bradyrhizobium sp. Arg816]MDI3563552.1 hypothetical protein [Bradyrhizobium sp. Arg816]